jgi:hypothetical protein
MSLKLCFECDGTMSDSARICPHCGCRHVLGEIDDVLYGVFGMFYACIALSVVIGIVSYIYMKLT